MFKPLILLLIGMTLAACQSNSLNDKYVNRYKDSLKPVSEVEKQIRKQYLIANDYFYGFEKKQNQKKACDIYETLAFKKDPESIHSYGNCFYFGEGREADNIKACKLYQESAHLGLASAQRDYSGCFKHNLHGEESIELALFWIKKAAQQNDPLALEYLEEIETGQVDYVKENPQLAFNTLKRYAVTSDEDAQLALAKIYSNDEIALYDLKKSIYWYKKAADQGNNEAEFETGKAYLNGIVLEQDLEHAFYWLERAAIDEFVDAYYYLGSAYYLGKGVEEDKQEAKKWFQLSADNGSQKALEFLQKLERNTSPTTKDKL